ncbi:hypothetical protein WJX72_011307 [[Myrmecia] bisecta]|uniref:Uncharacterized protein n=1 Tax=[Myrmecia] bisecta TaxID=41462 RepID=A0AAW1PQ15_9CHLO
MSTEHAKAAKRAALWAADEHACRQADVAENARQTAAAASLAAAGVSKEEGRRWMEAAKSGKVHEQKRLLAGAPRLLAYQGQGTNYSFTGHTALHWAAAKGHLAAIKWLLLKGANPNAQNHAGATPLHAAVSNSQVAAASMLLFEGEADPELRDDFGELALDVALERCHAAVKLMHIAAKVVPMRKQEAQQWSLRDMRTLLGLVDSG